MARVSPRLSQGRRGNQPVLAGVRLRQRADVGSSLARYIECANRRVKPSVCYLSHLLRPQAHEVIVMPKYLVQASYTTEGAKSFVRDGGTGRREAIAKMAESVGGKLETIYFAFGDVDAYIIVDLPDNVSAAAVWLASNRSGTVTSKTVVLLTPEEMDQVSKKTIEFRMPGR